MNKTATNTMSTLLSRIAFSIVFLSNIYCALQFILNPSDFVSAYQLSGAGSTAAIVGVGVSFLMWNATYPPYIFAPQKYPILGIVIIAQQLIGLVGESLLLLSLDRAIHATLVSSIERFIIFDAAGLALLLAGIFIQRLERTYE